MLGGGGRWVTAQASVDLVRDAGPQDVRLFTDTGVIGQLQGWVNGGRVRGPRRGFSSHTRWRIPQREGRSEPKAGRSSNRAGPWTMQEPLCGESEDMDSWLASACTPRAREGEAARGQGTQNRLGLR